MFEYIILDLIYIFTPFLLYTISSIYNYSVKEKENKIVLSFTILTSFYLICRFGQTFYSHVLLLINIPLLIAYYKKQNILIIFVSLSIIIYYNLYFNINIYLLILMYLLLFIVNKFVNKKNTLIISYVVLNFIIAVLTNNYNFKVVLLLLTIYIISFIIIELLKLCERLTDLNTRIQQFEQEKQIKSNLFKITHEIKNPIAVCKGYLDMFDLNNKNHLKYIPIIKDEINKTLLLLQDFLAMNKIKINKDILDVNCLIEEVKNSFIPIFRTKKIRYIIELDEEELLTYGDYNRLNQVLTNIIKNAVEAIDKNGFIKVTTKLKDKIYIYIKDNGCGMDEETIKKIKEPFYTTKRNGTGLGVSLSCEIIQAHNGTIDYKSKNKKGTTVIITLPIYEC